MPRSWRGRGRTSAPATRSWPSTSRRSTRTCHDLEHERRLVARERQAIGESELRLKAREEALRQREETFRRKTEDRLDERLRDARREIDKVIDDLKKKAADMTADAERRLSKRSFSGPPISTGDAGAARVEARQALEEAAARFHGDAPRTGAPAGLEGRPVCRRSGASWRASGSRACWRCCTATTPRST